MIQPILKSLLILGAISGSIAFFLTTFNVEFWKSFILLTVAQITVWNIYKHIYETKVTLRQRELDNEMMESLAKQSVVLPCAYCNRDNMVPIRFDLVNEFDCDECDKKNAVYVDLKSVQMTTPLTLTDTLNINEGR